VAATFSQVQANLLAPLYYHQFLLLLPEMLKNFHIPPNIYQTDNQRFRIKEAL